MTMCTVKNHLFTPVNVQPDGAMTDTSAGQSALGEQCEAIITSATFPSSGHLFQVPILGWVGKGVKVNYKLLMLPIIPNTL